MLLEDLSSATYQRIALRERFVVRQGEETMTDVLLLDLARASLPLVSARKVARLRESREGMDWEMWVRHDRRGWVRYAVQAKRHKANLKYADVGHVVRGSSERQIDLLARFCRLTGSVGTYCLYNSPGRTVRDSEWHCSRARNDEHLGCSIVPLYVMQEVLRPHHAPSFAEIHQRPEVMPLRCLFCDHGGFWPGVDQKFHPPGEVRFHSQLPDALASGTDEDIAVTDVLYPLGFVPKMVLVIDLEGR